ncbi:hypothetical protein MNV49_000352 [Pseudohyphozyma bogoriensis]|nr:hypothetical protein MNV49_000352 [Pseudohyphozyma bogoriensis]
MLSMRSTLGLLFLAHQAVAVVPTAITPSFGWQTNYDSSAQIPSCGEVIFAYALLQGETATLQGPFTVQVFADGYPHVIIGGDRTNTDTYSTMNITLPFSAGAKVSFAMFDYNGYYGGAAGPYTVVSSSESCDFVPAEQGIAVSYSDVASDGTVCGSSFTVSGSGGSPPYYFGLVDPNTSNGFYATSDDLSSASNILVELGSFVPSGAQFYFYLADSVHEWSANAVLTNGRGTSACGGTTSSAAGTTTAKPSSTSSVPARSASAVTSSVSGGTVKNLPGVSGGTSLDYS